MKTTIDFLAAVKARHSITSDYSLAPLLGISRQAVSLLQNGKDFMGETTAIRVAELLEIDAGYVMACAAAERSKNASARAAWETIIARLGGAAASILVGLALGAAPSPAPAEPAVDLYYVNSKNIFMHCGHLGVRAPT